MICAVAVVGLYEHLTTHALKYRPAVVKSGTILRFIKCNGRTTYTNHTLFCSELGWFDWFHAQPVVILTHADIFKNRLLIFMEWNNYFDLLRDFETCIEAM